MADTAAIEQAMPGHVGDAEVVVLAQASMAGVAQVLTGLDVKVLSSPDRNVRRAILAAQVR